MATQKTTKTPITAPVENSSLSDKAYEQLEEMIVTMKLAPGTPVSESQLSTMIGIGRTPIREAIQRLSHEHLVSIMPKRGIFISDLNPQKQLRVLETRRELERLICKKSAKRCNPEERKHFERMTKDFQRAGNFHQIGDITVAATLHANIAHAIFMGSEKKAGLAVDKLLDYIEEFTRKTVMSQE